MYWYDGNLIEQDTLQIGINEPGFLYGATVFSTMRVYEQSLAHPLTHWQAHCDRICHSIGVFNWQQPDWQRLKQGAELLLTHYPILRIAVLPDGRELITGRNLPIDLPERQQQGITAWVAEDNLFRRDLAAHKTGNYLGSYLALQKAHQLGVQEAILVDSDGNWLETSTGNLWGWRDRCWYTPALSVGILPGIIRGQLLIWLRSQNIPVAENIWTSDFVCSLESLAYTNCVVEVVAISKVINFQCNFNKSVSVTQIKDLKSYFLRRN